MAATVNPSFSATLKSQRVFVGQTGTQVSETWAVPSGDASSFESTYAIGTAHSVVTSAKLRARNKEPLIGDTTAVYKYDLDFSPSEGAAPSPAWKPAGEESIETSTNAYDRSIDAHPTLSAAQKTALRNDGETSYNAPQTTFKHSAYSDRAAFFLTESEAVAGVGKIASIGTLHAAGMLSATENKWLMIDRQVRFKSGVVEVSRVWQYNPDGWDTNIYAVE